MAEIFRAKTEGPSDFSKEVAIKKILPSLAYNEDFVTQFLDEARIAGCLSHPNIVQIFDVGQVEESYYIAMEYVHCRHLGQTVRRVLDSIYYFPFAEAAAIINEVSKALAYAHTAVDMNGEPLQVIHRDISPQNILLSFNGSIKLTDFGIAKATNKLYQTTVGVIKGKFSYLAPEQLKGDSASPRSDLFSLGVVLWEVLSGRRLFLGQSDLATIQLVQACEIPPIRSLRPDIPTELEEIVHKLLEPDPTLRYQSAQEVSRDLEYFLSLSGPHGMSLIVQFMRHLFPEMAPMQNQEIRQTPEEATNPGYVRPPSQYDEPEVVVQEVVEEDEVPTLFEEMAVPESDPEAIKVSSTLIDQQAFELDELLEVPAESYPATESLEVFEKLTAPLNSNDPAYPSPPDAYSSPGDSYSNLELREEDELAGEEDLLDSTLNEPASSNPLYGYEEESNTQPNILEAVRETANDTDPLEAQEPGKSRVGLIFAVLLLLFLGAGGGGAWYFRGQLEPLLKKYLPGKKVVVIKEKAPVLILKLFPAQVKVFANNAMLEGNGTLRTTKLVAGQTYRLEFRQKGYLMQKRIVMPEEGDEIRLNITLKPRAGVILNPTRKAPVPLREQNKEPQPGGTPGGTPKAPQKTKTFPPKKTPPVSPTPLPNKR